MGGEPLHEESEASHVVEAHTGACSEEESMGNLSSQSQETFFEKLVAEDKNSDEVMSSSKDDPGLRETSCQNLFDVRTAISSMVQKNKSNIDAYRPYIFANVFS